jgi:hypothetical protein
MQGKIPSNMLIVSFFDKPRINYDPIVYARPEETYDWRFAARMDTVMVCPIDMRNMQRHMKAMLAHVARPLNYFHPDAELGGNVYLFPEADSIDAWVQGKITKSQWKWHLDHLPWLDSQNYEFQKFLRETACESDRRYH